MVLKVEVMFLRHDGVKKRMTEDPRTKKSSHFLMTRQYHGPKIKINRAELDSTIAWSKSKETTNLSRNMPPRIHNSSGDFDICAAISMAMTGNDTMITHVHCVI